MATRAELSRLRRQSVIDATAALIEEAGTESLTLRQVAERANVAAGTIFLYFENKNDLVTHVLSEVVGRRWHRILDENTGLSPLDRVEDLYLGCVDIYYADFENVGELYTGMTTRKNVSYPEAERLYERVRATLEQARKIGQIRPDTDVAILALSFRTLYGIVLNIAREGGSHAEARSALQAAHAFLRHGVAAPAGA